MSSRFINTRCAAFRVVALVALIIGVSSAVQAQITIYGTRAAFNAAAPDTALVGFGTGVISDPANGAYFDGPLNSETNNAVFSPGDIWNGIEFSNSCSPTGGLILAGPGFDNWGWAGTGGFPSKVLIPASDACSLVISFVGAVDAVALEVYAESDSGFRVSVYGFGGVLLQHINKAAGETTPGFLGIISEDPITRIVMKAPMGTPTGAFEAADNVTFGAFPLFADGFESGSTSGWD